MKTKKLFALILIFTSVWSYSYAQLSISFSTSTYNGFNISCFGGNNGWVTANVTGGTPPYTYLWSNSSTTQTISGLPASYYAVTVTDATNATKQSGLNLREPLKITVGLTSTLYSNGYNVSCYQCFNGSITNTVSGGVSPYTYSWVNGPTTQNRTSVGGGQYTVIVTDANACSLPQIIMLSEPARSDWTMTGNTGSNPATNYIGTTDNTDFVLRTNGTERMRLNNLGNVALKSNVTIDSTLKLSRASFTPNQADSVSGNNPYRILSVDQNGNAFIIGPIDPVFPGPPFPSCVPAAVWSYAPLISTLYPSGNIMKCPINGWVAIGSAGDGSKLSVMSSGNSSNSVAFHVMNSDVNTLMMVKDDGKVGIGTDAIPTDYLLAVKGKIIAEEVKIKLFNSGWPDYVFENNYKRMSLSELENFIKENKHLPGIAPADEVKKEDGFEIGDMQMKLLMKIEELTLYIIEQNKRIEKLERKLSK